MWNAAAVGCKSGSSNCRSLIVDTSKWAASGAVIRKGRELRMHPEKVTGVGALRHFRLLHIAYGGLPAIANVDVLDADVLLPAVS